MRNLVDSRLPAVAKTWREVRDWWRWRRARPLPTAYGFRLYGDAGLDQSRTESGEIEVVRRFLTPGTAFVDIGANVGLFSCLASSLGCPALAIEPEPRNAQLLCRNLFVNGFTDVEVLPVALSDSVGVMPLYGGGQGASLREGWSGMRSTYSRLVPVTTLDLVLGGRFPDIPLFIKMDVEGNEYMALQGAGSTLARRDTVWIVEHGLTENFAGINPHYQALFELFWSHGYRAYGVSTMQVVSPSLVERWVKQGRRDRDELNFLFARGDLNDTQPAGR